MKRPDFGGVLKIGSFFQMLWVCCLLQVFEFLTKLVGYLTGHRWWRTSGAHKEVC
jgi:hypothetical protein